MTTCLTNLFSMTVYAKLKIDFVYLLSAPEKLEYSVARKVNNFYQIIPNNNIMKFDKAHKTLTNTLLWAMGFLISDVSRSSVVTQSYWERVSNVYCLYSNNGETKEKKRTIKRREDHFTNAYRESIGVQLLNWILIKRTKVWHLSIIS